MRIKNYIIVSIIFIILSSCRQHVEKETTNYEYFDIGDLDTVAKANLFAVTNEEFLQYGSDVAFVNNNGDTIIPFGRFGYLGTDTLKHYANVFLKPNNNLAGRWVGIDNTGKILFDLVNFDNGPDYFKDGLTRVTRNGKMGFANEYGHVAIPCVYDYAYWFKNGEAEVAYKATVYFDNDEHTRVESDEWFVINKTGKKINTTP